MTTTLSSYSPFAELGVNQNRGSDPTYAALLA